MNLTAHGAGPVRRFLAGAVLAIAIACALLASEACSGSQAHRAASVTIVAAGGAVAQMRTVHRSAYVAANDALMARGVIGLEYERQIAPIDREFEARTQAIGAITTALYAAAAIVNATDQDAGFGAYRTAAVDTLSAINAAVALLQRGSILPPVPIPPEVNAAISALQAVVAGVQL
jgi:hypothetical protein